MVNFIRMIKRALRLERPEPVVPRGRAGAAEHIAKLKGELEGYKAEAAVITATPEAMVANAEKASALRLKISASRYHIDRMEFVLALMDLNDEHIAYLESQLGEMAKAEGDVCKRLDAAASMARVKERLGQAKSLAEAMEGSDPYEVWDVVNEMCEQRFTVDESNKEWHIEHTLEYLSNHVVITVD